MTAEDEEKARAEAEATAARLARFRKDQGASPSEERERAAEIDAAVQKARFSMARGICSEVRGFACLLRLFALVVCLVCLDGCCLVVWTPPSLHLSSCLFFHPFPRTTNHEMID